MKLALFNDYVPGVVVGDKMVDVSAVVGSAITALRPNERMPAIIEAFDQLRPQLEAAAKGQGVPLSQVKLRSPLPRPNKMLMAIGNFYEGTKTAARPIGLFLKASSAVLDPGGTVELPVLDATIFHHEAEIALVIGKRAKEVPAAQAMDHVFGYMAFMDISARGLGGGVLYADKSPDTFAPFGPWIVTKDEVPNPQNVQIRMWVNGQPRHDYNTSDMEHSPAELIAWGSNVSALEVGDIISCGTNHQGLGPVQDGDTVEIEVEKIGRFSVKVHDKLKRKWPAEIDKEVATFVRESRSNPSLPRPKNLAPKAAAR